MGVKTGKPVVGYVPCRWHGGKLCCLCSDSGSDYREGSNHRTGTVRKRYIEARSYNHCCSGKAISITYSECVCIALFIQHAFRMRHIVICKPARLYNIFPHYLTNGTVFERKKKLLSIKCMFRFSLQLLSESHSEKNSARYDQKCLLVFVRVIFVTC